MCVMMTIGGGMEVERRIFHSSRRRRRRANRLRNKFITAIKLDARAFSVCCQTFLAMECDVLKA